MSYQMKFSLLNLIIWLVVAVLFLSVFLTGNTIENWGDNHAKTLILAFLFAIGYLGQLILRIIFRKRKNVIIRDERDEYFLNKALTSSFVATLIYVFIVAISLYTYYEKSGLIPVAWIWFIAYSLIIVANIFTSGFAIFFYRKGGN
ncbi:hypothetical protein [Caloranaerobacter ferrireducens]|uniref:hypothetical protein n=1 Tax=Caloranaerobacter ferrireducens TaxID=1323370 RepID=UPI00084D64F3|nr:hypothetical protein [Caloranaerobacter ferrireducens]